MSKRKYKIMIGVLGLALVCLVAGYLHLKKVNESEQTYMPIDIELVGTTQGNWEDRLDVLYEINRKRGDLDRMYRHTVWWMQVISKEEWQALGQEYDFVTPELNFEENYYILGFGCTIENVGYVGKQETESGGLYTKVSFGRQDERKDWQGNVYIYAMDKIKLMDTRIDNEELLYLNYGDDHLIEMPVTLVAVTEGNWKHYDLFDNYLQRKMLRYEGISWWYQINAGDWGWRQDIFHISDEINLDFGKEYYVISLGREIERLWYSDTFTMALSSSENARHYAKVEFNMDDYKENEVYIYRLDSDVLLIDTEEGYEYDLVKFNFVDK